MKKGYFIFEGKTCMGNIVILTKKFKRGGESKLMKQTQKGHEEPNHATTGCGQIPLVKWSIACLDTTDDFAARS